MQIRKWGVSKDLQASSLYRRLLISLCELYVVGINQGYTGLTYMEYIGDFQGSVF